MKQRVALKIMRCYAWKWAPHASYSYLVERASRALRPSWARRGYLPPPRIIRVVDEATPALRRMRDEIEEMLRLFGQGKAIIVPRCPGMELIEIKG